MRFFETKCLIDSWISIIADIFSLSIIIPVVLGLSHTSLIVSLPLEYFSITNFSDSFLYFFVDFLFGISAVSVPFASNPIFSKLLLNLSAIILLFNFR